MMAARQRGNERITVHNPPAAQGLYDPANEHDACGVGFVAHIKGKKSHAIIEQGLQILKNLTHRGAVGADPLAGDGRYSHSNSRRFLSRGDV
jgi:glutamate synthase domain-containing protein 1